VGGALALLGAAAGMHPSRAHLDPVPIVFRGLSRCAHLFHSK